MSVALHHTKGELREALTGNERGWLGTEEATIPWDFGGKSGTESSCSSFTCDASCLSWRGCSTNVLWTRAGAAMGQLSLPCSYLGFQVHKDGFPKCRDWKLEQGPRLSQCYGLRLCLKLCHGCLSHQHGRNIPVLWTERSGLVERWLCEALQTNWLSCARSDRSPWVRQAGSRPRCVL